MVVFSRQLATLLESGVTLLPALELLNGQAGSSRPFRKMLSTIIDDIRAGSSFSQATGKHRQVFGDIYCKTLATGERMGEMQSVLRQLAEHLEKQGVLTKKVTKALTYPMIVLVLGVGVVLVLLTTALPSLVDMFANMNVVLPLPTRILMGVSKFFNAFKLYLLVGVGTLVVIVVVYLRQPSGRRMLDRIRLTVPVIGPPAHMAEMARFSRTVSILVTAGLSLQEIMELMPETSSNSLMRNSLKQVHRELLLGQGMAGPMSRISIFPPLLVQMVAVGEESNTLGSTLRVVADFYEVAAEERIGAMVGLIQPLSTVAIALLVGFIALAVIMPMYTITGAFE